jgi:hypothetical protein
MPLAEYHFFRETVGVRANGSLIAADRAGNMDLYGYNGAAIVFDSGLNVNVLQLQNPVTQPVNLAAIQTAQSRANTGPRPVRDKAFIAYFTQNAANGPDAGVISMHSDAGDNEIGGMTCNVGASSSFNS